MQKQNYLANPNNFGTKIFVMFYLRKCIPTLDVFVHKIRKLWAFEVLK